MNFEQILIRLGVDSTAVKTGLGRVSSYAKAWGVGLVNDLKGTFGGMFAVGAAIEGLNKIRERMLEISNISRETGADTNFVQGMMQASEKLGISFDKAKMGLNRFNHELGAAKMGEADALKKLADIGVITDKTNIKTLTFAGAIHNLAVKFDQLNDKQKQAYILSQAFGRGYDAMQPVFAQGAKAVDDMSKDSPFTKLQPDTIGIFATAWAATKQAGIILGATIGNALGETVHVAYAAQQYFMRSASIIYGWKYYTGLVKSDIESFTKTKSNSDEKSVATAELEIEAGKQGIEIEELKAKVLERQRELTQKQLDLKGDIADRDKESVREMADQARKFSGAKSPLEMLRTVTPRMRTALKVDTLEERSKIAFLKGDDKLSDKLQSEADQIRASSPWMMRKDRNPMLKTEQELKTITIELEPVARMALMVNNSNK